MLLCWDTLTRKEGLVLTQTSKGYTYIFLSWQNIPLSRQYTPHQSTIYTYCSSIYPYQGSIQPYQSSILPYQGSIHPYQGSIYPYGGNVYPYRGCLGLKTLVTSFSAIKKKKAICVLLSYIPPPPFLCSPIPWLVLGWVFIVQTTLSRYSFTGMARG